MPYLVELVFKFPIDWHLNLKTLFFWKFFEKKDDDYDDDDYKKCEIWSINKFPNKWLESLAEVVSCSKQTVFLLSAVIWLNYDWETAKNKLFFAQKCYSLFFFPKNV